MPTKKIYRSALLMLCCSLFGLSAYAENNKATVVVHNKTNVVAQYTYEQMSGTADPLMSDVRATESKTFIVTSFADSVSGMRFVYTSGGKKCRFSVSHIATPPSYIPTWKKDAVSIGSSRATCDVNIEKISGQMPYHYTVKFTIQ